MRALPLAAILLLLAPLAPASHAGAHVEDLYVAVDGEPAHGLVGRPAGTPLGLVVLLHGYTHVAESHRGHLLHLAEQGWLAVAMDYRGSGFPLGTGAADTLAAMDVLGASSFDRVVLYSVSMGTAVAPMVLAASPGVFDEWVISEGLSMLHETWAEAATVAVSGHEFAVRARDDIEAECGGTPATEAACYVERSAALRAHEYVGLRGVVLAHGLNDGIVPYDQGRKMVSALRAVGIPSDFYTAVRSGPGAEGTTVTSYAGLGGQGLAGHGSEANDAHMLTWLTFGLLDDVLSGALVASNAERVVDQELGTLP